ncbi:hypothetical protein AQ490_21660 [Wenjunlia vitaminophila]|uniref:F5/8 type C domain-containing protein n=1 Tax=Wenjunlia vitaminophila TaxID=76728 RepID=A0A0T6LSW1_WENVI|nr:discoidin domain-containing protein [Wenjunlia vitaminophila]KRV49104.1 hypothetical protein AQ490_21660 [Wenjunlia vitaminophila]
MPENHTGRRPRLPYLLTPLVTAALVIGGVNLAAGHRAEPAAADRDTAEDGRAGALVVSANLQDAIRGADARDTRDLDTFVRRLTASTPQAPDVLLLTEVLGPGAQRVAQRLEATTGDQYQVLAAPGRSAFLSDGAVRESAIVLNTSTMRVVRDAAFVRVQGEDQVSAVVAERGTDLRLPVVSAHAAGDPLPAVEELHAHLSQLAASVDDGDAVPVLGGDHRASRCVEQAAYQAVDCAPQPFWTALTTTHGYDDALFDRSGAETVRHSGYVFARGAVIDAGLDTSYARDLPDSTVCKDAFDSGRSSSASPECRAGYYADAPFGWAVVGVGEPVRRAVVPSRIALDHCELGTRHAAALARVVNTTGEDVTDQVRVVAPAALSVTPESGELSVPAGEARTLPLRVSAPQDTPAGTHEVAVTIGDLETRLTVSLPQACDEAPVTATSYHSGFPPTHATDGDINTFWHSEYSPPTPLPQSITLNLRETRQVSTLTYQPRFDGNLNGTIRDYTVYTSTDGRTFTEVASGTWTVDARLKSVTFPPVDARYVRLEALSASGGSYASAAEVTAG